MIKLSESNPTKVNLTIFLVYTSAVLIQTELLAATESLAQQSSSTPGHGSGSNELKKFNRVLGKVIFPRTIQNLKKYAYFLTCKRESQWSASCVESRGWKWLCVSQSQITDSEVWLKFPPLIWGNTSKQRPSAPPMGYWYRPRRQKLLNLVFFFLHVITLLEHKKQMKKKKETLKNIYIYILLICYAV